MEEYEEKMLLTKKEYDVLLKHTFDYGEPTSQINYYFDTDSFGYNSLGITCRIREKNGNYIAAIKEHRKGGKSIETIMRVNNSYDSSLFEGMNVKYQGMLVTERRISRPHIGIAVMLDKNAYLGMVDYEIEVEYHPQYYRDAIQTIEQISRTLFRYADAESVTNTVERFEHSKNKSQRFFEQLVKIKLDSGKEELLWRTYM